ncbi:MAG: efflux RND transporter periplasmic adaptor subunit [Verrucomicrobia bacterium]|nr:efflux RND transporter periplasmic adaptor subunit [Verrucomicrobiota bacterium]
MNTRSVLSGLLLLPTSLLLVGCGAHPQEGETASTEVAVQVGKVTRVTLHARVDAYGTVEAEPAGGGKPAGLARLSAPAAGLVMAVPVREGEPVEAGTVVARLDDRVALAQIERARQTVQYAEQQLARQNQLRLVEGTSEQRGQEAAQQLAAAQSELAVAQAALAQVHLTAPLAGIVARIHVSPGQTVEPNTVVAEVIDPARVVATVTVPATEAASLRAGQPAELRTGHDAGAAAQGTVRYVSPQVDSKTATVLVRISLPSDAGLRAGQFVHARIITEERTDRLAVPRAAVYTHHDGESTLSTVEGDNATQRTVKVGLRDGDLVEIEGDGVTEGATVVTLGSYALPRETKVRILAAGDAGRATEESSR